MAKQLLELTVTRIAGAPFHPLCCPSTVTIAYQDWFDDADVSIRATHELLHLHRECHPKDIYGQGTEMDLKKLGSNTFFGIRSSPSVLADRHREELVDDPANEAAKQTRRRRMADMLSGGAVLMHMQDGTWRWALLRVDDSWVMDTLPDADLLMCPSARHILMLDRFRCASTDSRPDKLFVPPSPLRRTITASATTADCSSLARERRLLFEFAASPDREAMLRTLAACIAVPARDKYRRHLSASPKWYTTSTSTSPEIDHRTQFSSIAERVRIAYGSKRSPWWTSNGRFVVAPASYTAGFAKRYHRRSITTTSLDIIHQNDLFGRVADLLRSPDNVLFMDHIGRVLSAVPGLIDREKWAADLCRAPRYLAVDRVRIGLLQHWEFISYCLARSDEKC